eukprot:954163-Ditylum_brightwellii.AAC.1
MVEDDTIVNIHTQEQNKSSTTPTFTYFLSTTAGQAPAIIIALAPTCTLLNNCPRPDNTYVTNMTTPTNDEKYAWISFPTFYSKLSESL